MRLPIILLLASSSAAAHANSAERARACNLDPAMVPEQCRSLAVGFALEAKISVASCLARLNLADVHPTDTTSSYAALNDAVRPSIQLLDEVIASGDPTATIEALHTKADLIDGMVVRMRNSAPPSPWNATPEQVELSNQRHDAIEVAIVDWRVESQNTYQRIVNLAATHPELADNPVVAADIRHAEASQGVIATR
jgi:hypothetical protein